MNLDQLQRAMFHAVRQPLTSEDRMRPTAADGVSLNGTAEMIIKPNARLTSFERLEIYNRQYWFRVISSMTDDFEGLRAILGDKRFQKLVIGYLVDHPSTSFTLRNLGSKLHPWLSAHLDYVEGVEDLCLDMVNLEWAEIEAFDAESRPPLSREDIAGLGEDPVLQLQPYVNLLELTYPVHNLLLKIRERRRNHNAPMRRLPSRSVPSRGRSFVAVHRSDNSVCFQDLDAQAFAMLRTLRDGGRVSKAIESADWSGRPVEQVAPMLQGYFAEWSARGWFCRCC